MNLCITFMQTSRGESFLLYFEEDCYFVNLRKVLKGGWPLV